MSGPLFQLPKVVPLSSTGALMAGAKLHFYAASTSTRQNTYQDADLTTPHTNPVVADANGVFPPIFLSPTLGDYKCVLTTSADVVLYTVDDLPATFDSAAVALSLDSLIRTTAETSAAVTPSNYAYPPGDIRRYGAVSGQDSTTAINNAVAQANAGGAPVWIPAGTFTVSSALTALTTNSVIDGEGSAAILKPTISDGTAVIALASNASNFTTLRNFCIDSGLNTASFIANGVNAQNCIGIQGGAAGANYATRWRLENLQIRGVKTGLDINGFIGTADKVQIYYCETGINGLNFNAVRANLHIEACRKDFAFTDSQGLHLDNCTMEGTNAAFLSSTMDNCHGVRMTAPYWEHDTNEQTVPFVVFGGTTECTDIEIDAAFAGNGSALAEGVALLKFDRVDGARVAGYFGTGAVLTNIETTANTKNFRARLTKQVTSWTQDASKCLARVENIWPNPRFDAWFRGWTDVSLTACTASQETTLVRRGPNALKLTCTAAAGSHYATLYIEGAVVTAMRGKTVAVGAWVYVPNIAAFNPASRTAYPWVQVQSYNGSVTVSPTDTDNGNATRTGWQFMWSEVAVQSDATRLIVNVFVNNSGNTLTTNEYIVVDSILVCEGGAQVVQAMENGDVIESGLNPCRLHGVLAELQGTAAPTDAQQTYAVGDRVWKTDVSAGGSPGWVCTTAGVGGVAVFKALANVAA